MNNTTAKRRDLIFFLLLVVMIKVALNKKPLLQDNPALFAPANQADTGNSPFHEPDRKLMDHLSNLSNQVEVALYAPDIAPKKKKALLATQERLSYLLHKYEYSSPAFVLLGPIASTGMVLQEQTLEKELNKIKDKLTDLHT